MVYRICQNDIKLKTGDLEFLQFLCKGIIIFSGHQKWNKIGVTKWFFCVVLEMSLCNGIKLTLRYVKFCMHEVLDRQQNKALQFHESGLWTILIGNDLKFD